MPRRSLVRLANSFVSGAVALEKRFDNPNPSVSAFSVISMYADWEEFCRRLLYASAAANPLASDGRLISRAPGIRGILDVDASLKRMKRRRPNQALILHLGAPRPMADACKHLAIDNERVILPAILSQNSPAQELRHIRNFFAHQNPSTALQIYRGPRGSDLEARSLVGWLGERQIGGQTRFGVWTSDLSAVARACTH